MAAATTPPVTSALSPAGVAPMKKAGMRCRRSPSAPPRPVGKGHAAGHGQGGERQRGHQRAGDPAHRVPALEPGRLREHGAPCPDHRRQQEQRSGQAEELGEKVGNDRAGEAQDVADGVIGGVAEARIVDRPGREAGGGHRRQGQNRQADHGADVAAQDVADRAAAGQGNGGRSGGEAHGGPWTRQQDGELERPTVTALGKAAINQGPGAGFYPAGALNFAVFPPEP